jgi:hypothetical protein
MIAPRYPSLSGGPPCCWLPLQFGWAINWAVMAHLGCIGGCTSEDCSPGGCGQCGVPEAWIEAWRVFGAAGDWPGAKKREVVGEMRERWAGAGWLGGPESHARGDNNSNATEGRPGGAGRRLNRRHPPAGRWKGKHSFLRSFLWRCQSPMLCCLPCMSCGCNRANCGAFLPSGSP